MEITYSLIIPHYNIPELLERLLSTIPKRNDLQVIVVDDCSTKNLSELNHLKEKYKWIEWHNTGTNGGGGKARNIGLTYACGKYVLFADADDYFFPQFEMILDNYKNSHADVIYFNIGEEANTIPSKRVLEYNRIMDKIGISEKYAINDLRFKYHCPWAKLIRIEIIKNFNIKFEEAIIHNDVLFSGKVGIYSTNIEITRIKAYCLTERTNSVSKILSKAQRLSRVKTFAQLNVEFKKNNIDRTDLLMLEPPIYFLKNFNLVALQESLKILKSYNFSIFKCMLLKFLQIINVLGR